MSSVEFDYKSIAKYSTLEYEIEFKKMKEGGVQIIAEQIFAGSFTGPTYKVDLSGYNIVSAQIGDSPKKIIKWLLESGYIPNIENDTVFFKKDITQIGISPTQGNNPSPHKIRKILERNSLKVASENIFSRPLRSILEVIVNGMDACVTQHPTGKFGMGIRSLYGLVDFEETHGCKITFETAYEVGAEDLCAYGFEFYKANGDYLVHKNTSTKAEKGTIVQVTPRAGSFSQETLEEILGYCYALQFYEHGCIEIRHGSGSTSIGKGNTALVTVHLSPQEIKIEDGGSGITEEVYETIICSSPGKSTKQPNMERITACCQFSEVAFKGRKISSHPSFLLLINGIVILDFPLLYVKKDFLVHLPSTVTLTLARDTVTLDSHLEECLQQLIQATIQDVVHGTSDPLLLAALHAGLRGLKFSELALYLEKILAEQVTLSKKIVFPLEEIDALNPILAYYCSSSDFLPLPTPLCLPFISTFQTMIADTIPNVNPSLFKGKTVLFVEDSLLKGKAVATYNFPGLLFARNSFLEVSEDLSWRLYSNYAEDGRSLYLYTDPSDIHRSSQFIIWKEVRPTIDYKTLDINCSLILDLVQDEETLQNCTDQPLEDFCKLVMEEDLIPNTYGYTRENEPYPHLLEIDRSYFYRKTISLREIKAAVGASCPVIIRIKDGLYIFHNEINEETLEALERQAKEQLSNPKSKLNDEISSSESSESQEKVKLELQKQLCRQEIQEEQFEEFVKTHCLPISFSQAGKLLLNYLLLLADIKGGDVIQFEDQSSLWPLHDGSNKEHLLVLYKALQKHCFKKRFGELPYPTFVTTVPSQEALLELGQFVPYELQFKISIGEAFYPMFELKVRLDENTTISEVNKNLFYMIILEILQKYHRFLLITTKDYDVQYSKIDKSGDETDIDDIFTTNPDVEPFISSVEESYLLLTALSEQNMEKILLFLREHFSEYLDLEKRNRFFYKNYGDTILVKNVLQNTGLSRLSKLYKWGLSATYINFILDHANSHDELAAICGFLPYKFVEEKSDGLDWKEMLLRSRIYSIGDSSYFRAAIKSALVKIRQKLQPDDNPYVGDVTAGIGQIRKFLENALEQQESLKRVVFLKEPLQSSLVPFTTNQLLNVFSGEDTIAGLVETALDAGNLGEFLQAVSQVLRDTTTRTLTSCIEFGSNRDPFQIAAIECFQNSLDAAKAYLRTSSSVKRNVENFYFSVEKTEDGGQLIFKIKDDVGIKDLKTLIIDVLLPNFSEKKQEEGNVGLMGNGGFQIYKEAEKVVITTRLLKDEKVYVLQVTPQRNDEGRVIDLSHICEEMTDKEMYIDFLGTEIAILYKNQGKDEGEIELEGIFLMDFLKNVFSTHPLQQYSEWKPTIFINGSEIKEGPLSKREVISYGGFSFIDKESAQAQGWVYTQGYPFIPLEEFLISHKLLSSELAKEFAMGWMLNLPQGSYQPTQGRVSIQIPPASLLDLEKLLVEWLFMCCFKSKKYFPHLFSSANFDQVYPSTQKKPPKDFTACLASAGREFLECLSVHYRSDFGRIPSFLGQIKAGYETLIENLKSHKQACLFVLKKRIMQNKIDGYENIIKKFESTCLTLFKQWKKAKRNALAEDLKKLCMLNEIIIPWFTPKFSMEIKTSFPSLSELKASQPALQTKEEAEIYKSQVEKIQSQLNTIYLNPINCAQLIIHHYADIYMELIGGDKINGINFIYDSTEVGAYYNNEDHAITINLYHYKISDILHFGQAILKKRPLENERGASLFLTSIGSSGTLNHELLHAYEKEECGNFHPNGCDLDGHFTTYENRAICIAIKVRAEGLFTDLARMISEGMSSIDLQTIISVTEECERIDRYIFYKNHYYGGSASFPPTTTRI